MLEVEGKLFVWLYCRMARVGLHNGWLMAFLVLAIMENRETFWWRVPVLYLLCVLIATVICRISPEAGSGETDWRETIADKRKEIETVVDAKDKIKDAVGMTKGKVDLVSASSGSGKSVVSEAIGTQNAEGCEC
jgi:hypothetical protein